VGKDGVWGGSAYLNIHVCNGVFFSRGRGCGRMECGVAVPN
jgi:hypothetical protein